MIAAGPPPAACIQHAAARYQVPAALIRGVLKVEAGGAGVVHHNRNGSDDLGWMQINTVWLPTLARYGIDRRVLLTRPCINIDVGAWILRKYRNRFTSWRRTIRAYNAGPSNNAGGHAYARRVIAAWRYSYWQDATTTLPPPRRRLRGPIIILASNTQD